MAMTTLGALEVGSIVKLNVSSNPEEFIVVHHGSPSSDYVGFENNTILWSKCLSPVLRTNPIFSSGPLGKWCLNTLPGLLDEDVQAILQEVYIPVAKNSNDTYDDVSTGTSGFKTKAFALSVNEMNRSGLSGEEQTYTVREGSTLSYFSSTPASKRVNTNVPSDHNYYWTRSRYTEHNARICSVDSTNGDYRGGRSTANEYPTPFAIVLPDSTLVSDDGTITFNPPPTAPASIDVTGVVRGGQATITLTAATDPYGTVESYRYERQVDGGQWQQFADVNSLTQTDQIGEDWGTVAYRACAVDNEGAAGPYVTSETETVNTGYLMIGGPVSNMGIQSIPFDFEATVGVSGETSITGIEATMWLDHVQVYHESVNQGATLEYHVDTRVMSSGQHTIQVTLEKEDYLPANAAYYFTVPSQGLPDGGMSVQLEDDQGNPLFPRTTTRDVIGPRGLTVQNEIEDLQKAHRGTTGHLEHIDTVLGPASNVVWPREANTTYASRYYGTSNETVAYNRLLPSGASGAITIGGASLNLAADSITLTSLASNTILELLKYVLDTHVVTPPDLTVNFTPLDQPKVLTAATNTGTTATDLQDALQQIIDAYPTQNLYMIEDAESSSTVYYVACVDTIDADTTSKTCAYVVSTNPTKWYQGVTLTFVDSSNPAKSFTQLSGNYTSEITTAGTESDKGSQNAALIALLQTNKGYYYKFTDHSGVVYYMASSTAISMSGDSVTANCDYVKNTETTVYTGGTISFYNVPDAPNWNVGQVVTFADIQWIVSHKTASECYLTSQALQGNSTWNNLQTTCQSFDSTYLTAESKAFLKQIKAGNTNGYVFVATKDQMDGGFSYFNSNSRRSVGSIYWTSTERDSGIAWFVNTSGNLGNYYDDGFGEAWDSYGFRPSICFDLTKYS